MVQIKKSIIILLRDVCDEWIELAKRAKLNTLGLHFIITENDVQSYLDWLNAGGHAFVEKMESEGIQIEHELHAVSHLHLIVTSLMPIVVSVPIPVTVIPFICLMCITAA